MPSVLVVGAGAIGASYGGVLARAGCEVSVVARSDRDVLVPRLESLYYLLQALEQKMQADA